MKEETIKNNNKPWLFKEGNEGGPGRPLDTEQDIIRKKATRELIAEYKEALGEALPLIRPILIAKALEGDIPAIKEIHDRVMDKAKQATDITTNGESIQQILVEFIDAKIKNNTNTTGV